VVARWRPSSSPRVSEHSRREHLDAGPTARVVARLGLAEIRHSSALRATPRRVTRRYECYLPVLSRGPAVRRAPFACPRRARPGHRSELDAPGCGRRTPVAVEDRQGGVPPLRPLRGGAREGRFVQRAGLPLPVADAARRRRAGKRGQLIGTQNREPACYRDGFRTWPHEVAAATDERPEAT
jgi:hypothetical protein